MQIERRYEWLYGRELQSRIAERAIAWVPLGPLERHCEHLPWGLDGLKAHAQCMRLADRYGGVVLPPIHIAGIHDPWHPNPNEYRRLRAEVGDWYLSTETLTAITNEMVDGLANIGFKIIVLNTGHYPAIQGVLLRQLAPALEKALGVRVIAFDEDEALTDCKVDHAGTYETSMFWSLGHEVRISAARPELANKTGNYSSNTPPHKATIERGLAWIAQLDAWFARKLAELGVAPLPPATPATDDPLAPVRRGVHRHYKGNYYTVLDVARHSETQECMVIYRALYGDFGTWVRPAKMFAEEVEVNGKRVKRFSPVDPW